MKRRTWSGSGRQSEHEAPEVGISLQERRGLRDGLFGGLGESLLRGRIHRDLVLVILGLLEKVGGREAVHAERVVAVEFLSPVSAGQEHIPGGVLGQLLDQALAERLGAGVIHAIDGVHDGA